MRGGRSSAARGLGLVVAVLAAGAATWASARAVERDLARPRSLEGAEFVGSGRCRSCHAEQYESWHGTFHRTMTQAATEASVLGDFDGAVLDYRGIRARMRRGDDGAFVIEFARGEARWSAVVDRVVGSHRYQQYLARRGSEHYRLPVAWQVQERRWFHMNAAFLTPDPAPEGPVSRQDYERHVTRWNDNCIFCHNVGPNPGLSGERFDTEVAELGVACEACHGPASDHVARNASPARRYALHLGDDRADPSITNPRRLAHGRASQVCGRCHGQRIAADITGVLGHGDTFVPGEDLSEHSRPLFRDSTLNGERGVFAARFWEDGTPRLTAYEYQGLLMSPCAERGELQCESCHAMHAGDPAGQLRPEARGDAACTSCHDELAKAAAKAEHSGHRADGPGARCNACHMPKLVYGLVGARISHRIEVPRPAENAADGRPDACTLCHVDRSAAWAAAGVALDADTAGEPPAVMRALLAGDPIERAIAAAALGRRDAPAPEAPRFGALLDAMEHDRYPAVRSIAWRAVRELWGERTPALELAAYDAAAGAVARGRAVGALRSLLGADVAPPDPALVAQLRPLAEQAAIFIGE